MGTHELVLLALVFFVFAVVSRRIIGTILTAPILFTLAGYGLGTTILQFGEAGFSEGVIHTIAEITLIVVLSADASRISARKLIEYRAIPIRLLGLALPMIILLGGAVGYYVLPGFSWLEAALLAAILAPTDAALGASVLSNPAIPQRIRHSLNVESGLNDGIALPAVIFFVCALNIEHQGDTRAWLTFLGLQLTLGPLVGILVGWIGGRLIGLTARREWITETFQGVAAIALAIVAFAAAESVNGNGFIAAFACGMIYGNLKMPYSHFMHEFTETESEILTYLTFFLFGAVLLPEALLHVTQETIVYAVASLTLVRMIPIALSTVGLGMRWPTRAFLGWFGPRGLASLLFALIVIEDLDFARADDLQSIVAITVLMSVILHGVTAAPFSTAYGRWHKKAGQNDHKLASAE